MRSLGCQEVADTQRINHWTSMIPRPRGNVFNMHFKRWCQININLCYLPTYLPSNRPFLRLPICLAKHTLNLPGKPSYLHYIRTCLTRAEKTLHHRGDTGKVIWNLILIYAIQSPQDSLPIRAGHNTLAKLPATLEPQRCGGQLTRKNSSPEPRSKDFAF